MKKGFTVVELIVSFSFIMIISIFLFQIIINLKNVYTRNGLKTEILSRQAILSNLINESIIENTLYGITSCGENCYMFEYVNGTSKELIVNKDNLTIQFGNYKTSFPNGTEINDISLNVIKVATFDKTKNDSILKLSIPISNNKINNQTFDINMYHQYSNSSYLNIEI